LDEFPGAVESWRAAFLLFHGGTGGAGRGQVRAGLMARSFIFHGDDEGDEGGVGSLSRAVPVLM
jgi:hypothetical protein